MGYDKDDNKIYTKESIDDDYQRLFEEITECGEHNWKEMLGKEVIDLEHPQYSSYKRLDFRHLLEFLLKLVGDDKKRVKKLQTAINSSAIQWDSFRAGQYRNVSSNIVEIGICTAAQFLKIPLISLLAQFIEDCENNKIRLSSYSEYEEIIKCFLQDAPRLVAQLQSKTTQPAIPDKQEQLPEQTVSENRYQIDRVENEEKWLDPYNYDALPLVGREKELELLNEFIEAEGQFKIWAIAGPSGAGKTRLACQWAYSSKVLADWDCRILHKEDRAETEQWANWLPDRPTLIIIDYLYGFEEVVLKLMSRRLKPTNSKVRLLLIDHVFPKPLHSDKRWGFSGDGSSLNRNEKFFFDLEPLDLGETQNQEEIIKSIIAHRARLDEKRNQVGEAHEYLLETKGAYHPLFAALVGDAIKSDKDFTVWNRRELIYYYLSGERLPWKQGNDAGRWASYFIAVATAQCGIAYEDLYEAASNCISAPEHFGDIEEICQKVIADNDETILAPFEPDILGESFFLKFLQFIKKPSKFKNEFRQVFMAGNEETQTEAAIEFAGFIQRLTRNLLNDDQSQNETRELWQTLFDFMRPSEFRNAEPIRWALTAGLIDIVDAIKDEFPEEELIFLLNQIEPTSLSCIQDSRFLKKAVLSFMRFFELTRKLTKNPLAFSEEMFALFDRYATSKIDEDTSLMIASKYGFNEIINALIDRGADTEATLIGGQNALMTASLNGQTEAIKRLLDAMANIHAADNEGRTALMWASVNGHADVVKLLLDKETNIHASDNEGHTALIWASINGHADVVKLLLDEGAKIDATDNQGRTAIFAASFEGYADVVKLLLNEEADIDATDSEGHTVLFLASFVGQVDVVKLLLDEGANIDVTDNGGRTALYAASAKGHAGVVKLLLDKEVEVDAADNQGHTALFEASSKGYVETAKLLLDKGADINIANIEGMTALICASFDGHIEVVKLLLDKEANIDAVDNRDATALIWASVKGQTEVVKLLLDKDAKINVADNQGRTALIWAIGKDHIETAKLLLDEGANIHAVDNEGLTALIWASMKCHVDVVKLLLDKGVNINVADNEGSTALIWASIKGHTSVVKLLLDEDADTDAIDNNGQTALSAATAEGHKEIIKLLVEHDAKI